MESGEDTTKAHSGFSGLLQTPPDDSVCPLKKKTSLAEESELLRAFKCI